MTDGWRPAPQGARVRPFGNGWQAVPAGDVDDPMGWDLTIGAAVERLHRLLLDRQLTRARKQRQREQSEQAWIDRLERQRAEVMA